MATGKVIYAGCNNAGGYGCWVKLDHGSGITSAYAHMIMGSIQVKTGQQVAVGTKLGTIGWTGKTSFGPHVHFVIYRNGQHVDPARLFDIGRMAPCNLCQSPGSQPVTATGIGAVANSRPAQQSYQPSAPVSMGGRLLAVILVTLVSVGPVDAAVFVSTVIFFVLFTLWLLPRDIRLILSCGLFSALCSLVVVVMFAQPVQADQARREVARLPSGTGAWEMGYKLTSGSEGFECTDDGAHTFGGITQGTYNAWAKSKGLPVRDVCSGVVTDKVRKAIFLERYWMKSGASALPPMLALTYVDHIFNTGSAKAGLMACGTNVMCFNDWRVRDYRSKGNCNLYCAGWLNRVKKFRRITE